MFNFGSPAMTAMIRSVYQAIGQAALSYLVVSQVAGQEAGLYASGLAALGALGFRGIAEARIDSNPVQKAADATKSSTGTGDGN